MKITSVKTKKITLKDTDLLKILDQYMPNLKENSVVAVTSKIVAITQGRVVPIRKVPRVPGVSQVSQEERRSAELEQKEALIQQESQYYLPRSSSKYNVNLTITNNMLAASAGIDESNAGGSYVLWPSNPQASANTIRLFLKKKFKLKHIGVIITDSKTSPLRWGVTAIALAYSGFKPLKNYIGKKDLFGRPFTFEQMSIIDNLAAAAALVMGEGSEQTPIAIIEDIPGTKFQDRNPTKKELDLLNISLEEDIYAPILKKAPWKKGRG